MMNGRPAQEGYVTFRSADPNKPAFTLHCSIEQGHYSSKSADTRLPFGDYEVRVSVTKKTGRQVPLPVAPGGKMQDEIIM